MTIIPVRDYGSSGYYAMVWGPKGCLWVTETKPTVADALRSARIWVQIHFPRAVIRMW